MLPHCVSSRSLLPGHPTAPSTLVDHQNLTPDQRPLPLYHDIPSRLYLPTTDPPLLHEPHPQSATTGLLVVNVNVIEQAAAVHAFACTDCTVECAPRGHGESATDDEHAGSGYEVLGGVRGGAFCGSGEGAGRREYEGEGGETGAGETGGEQMRRGTAVRL